MRYILHLYELDRSHIALAGGKGANLGELMRIDGICVPAGFCVTSDAYAKIVARQTSLEDLFTRLSHADAQDSEAIRKLGADIRRAIDDVAIPDDLASEITRALATLGDDTACAVRSSATAEDLPTASFAGQQDTFLNIAGAADVLRHMRRCWASLFTDRAITYRMHNGIDHCIVHMAVVVQRMVSAAVSGVLFTADPVSGNRTISAIEATAGLGEGLVAGHVNADSYRVRDDHVVAREIRHAPTLTDAQAVQLAQIGRRIEQHFAAPQDIEWCLADGEFHIVQSRPITTLFPIPARDDTQNRVYVSVGHQQMMTDAMRPLGISVWQLLAARPMRVAGSRLFVDITTELTNPSMRQNLLMLAKSDPLVEDALKTVIESEFVRTLPDDNVDAPRTAPRKGEDIENDPRIVAELIAKAETSLDELKRAIADREGPALFDFILEDVQEMRRLMFDPASNRALMAGIEATWWLSDKLLEWLGERNAADTLAQSAPNNITSEMGLALLDVADAIRPHAPVVEYLAEIRDNDYFLDALHDIPGGDEARAAIMQWLDRYGMRCAGEIDITRPRWSERPATLVPLVLGNIRNFAHGEATRRFEDGKEEARRKEAELLRRLKELPDGEAKANETKTMVDRLRTFIGFREYPKYHMISRFFVYKQALLTDAQRLVHERVIDDVDDIFFLTFQELHDASRTRHADRALIRQRMAEFERHRTLMPPRLLTSEGEAIHGKYRRENVPDGALVGLGVSTGIVEGRARVILDMAAADLQPGDILVTRFTDPSWTPAFVSVAGLVTEVGGLMTHGAVIAREYGLPAVVGIERATERIRDGQRIRVDGTEGFVSQIPMEPPGSPP